MTQNQENNRNLHKDRADEAAERAELIESLSSLERMNDQLTQLAGVQHLLNIPLTMQQLKCLALISTAPEELSAQHLVELLDVSPPTVSGIIDRLVEHDMVERIPHPQDQRSRILRATTQGQQVLHTLLSRAEDLHLHALHAMELQDLRALCQGMTAFRKAFAQEVDAQRDPSLPAD